MKTKFLLLLIFSFTHIIQAQEYYYSLEDFMNNNNLLIAQDISMIDNEINNDNFQLLKKSFLPLVSLNLNLPGYRHSISNILQPDGSYAFREINYADSNVGLSITQKIPWTGGEITISNSLRRLDIVNDNNNNTSYSASWLSLKLTQPLSFFNQYKWDKKIMRNNFILTNIKIEKNYYDALETALNDYFEILEIQTKIELLAKQINDTEKINLRIQNLIMAGRRKQLDSVEVQLELLNKHNELNSNKNQKKIIFQNLDQLYKININNSFKLKFPDMSIKLKSEEYYVKKFEELNEHYKRNILIPLKKEKEKLEKERIFNATLSAGIGYNTSQNELENVFSNPNQSQIFTVSIDIPILNFGKKKLEYLIAKKQLSAEELKINQEKISNIKNMKVIYEQIIFQKSQIKQLDKKIKLLKLKIKNYRRLLSENYILIEDYFQSEYEIYDSHINKIEVAHNLFLNIIKLEKYSSEKILTW